jgi:hypothetical protein
MMVLTTSSAVKSINPGNIKKSLKNKKKNNGNIKKSLKNKKKNNGNIKNLTQLCKSIFYANGKLFQNLDIGSIFLA